MNNKFSTNRAQAELQGPVGAAFDLDSSIDEAAAAGGLASSASAFVNSAIKCFLAGMDEDGYLLAQKSIAWFSLAISSREMPGRYFEGGTEANRLYGLALAKWLAGERSSGEVSESIEYREKYLSGKAGRDPAEVSLSLVEYLDGGRKELIKFHVDRLWHNKKVPIEVGAIMKLCDALPVEEKQFQVISLLRSSADEWLSRGHFDRFAKWVKVAASDQSDRKAEPEWLREMYALIN